MTHDTYMYIMTILLMPHSYLFLPVRDTESGLLVAGLKAGVLLLRQHLLTNHQSTQPLASHVTTLASRKGQTDMLHTTCTCTHVHTTCTMYTCMCTLTLHPLQLSLLRFNILYSRKYWRGIIFGGFLVTPPSLN